MREFDEEDASASPYSRKVGERLRVIRRQKRDIAVILSAEEYDRLRAFNVAEFNHFCDRVAGKAAARGLTAKKLQQILHD